jgi:putative chitinase
MKLQDITDAKPFLYLAEDSELCLEVQQALQNERLYQGVDGIYGARTQNALVNFKLRKKLTGGNRIGKLTAASLLKSLEAIPVLVTKEQAEFVYETTLYDSEFNDLNACLLRFGITAKEDIREFLAQTAHESGGLKYSKELASGWDYEWREELGNTQAGDGPKYKGGGFLQTTGRYGYQRLSDFLNDPRVMEGVDYVSKVLPFTAGGFWWYDNQMSEYIASGATLEQVTKRVNGGYNGLEDRRYYYNRAKQVI